RHLRIWLAPTSAPTPSSTLLPYTTLFRSFQDRGSQYKTAIFYTNEDQKAVAEDYVAQLKQTIDKEKAIATKILPASTFYEAEAEHQDFYKKNPERYAQEQQERQKYK